MDKNPLGLDGFEFVEFACEKIEVLENLFLNMGFTEIAKHKQKDIFLFRQNKINFLVNCDKSEYAYEFSQQHGPCASSMGFRVKDPKQALEHAVKKGAKKFEQQTTLPAIYGIGDSLLYFADREKSKKLYEDNFNFYDNVDKYPKGNGLEEIDHLTHNVYRGNMDKWANFYTDIFNFKQIRYFDIQGSQTGLISRAMGSPCGKIKIPLNESKDNESQIEEFLQQYNGEGIQHVALNTQDIYKSVEELSKKKLKFLTVPDTYYEMVDERIKDHHEDLARMQKDQLLIDGSIEKKEGLLLQIFTENVIGPIFFEIIQRKGNDGFGEGNFQALFESIERDQIRRGVLK